MNDIATLKSQFRKAVIAYRNTLSSDMDCGLHMQAVIRANVGMKAQRANELGTKLKAIDPAFPSSWTPYPTGR